MPNNRFTIYDALEHAGFFSKNPANPASRDADGMPLYTGPVPYPKMLYHPDGEEKIIVPAEIIATPLGAKEVGEQRELINKIVQNEADDVIAQADGWHDHPSKAIRVRVEKKIADGNFTEKEINKLLASIPTMSSSTRIADLEKEIERLKAEKGREDTAKANEDSLRNKPIQAPAAAAE